MTNPRSAKVLEGKKYVIHTFTKTLKQLRIIIKVEIAFQEFY